MTIALITGGNRGLGRAISEQLADAGMEVVIGCRDLSYGHAAAIEIGRGARAVRLDVTDPDSIRDAAEWFRSELGGLDVLINNAGILPEASNAEPAEAVDLAMFRRTFETNLFGAVGVLEAFLPLLRSSEAGRIVNISSTMGSLSDQTTPESPFYGTVVPAYQGSKAALNNVTIALAKSLRDTPIKITSICPGYVQTDLAPSSREQAPLTPAEGAQVVLAAATLPAEAPSGTFIDSSGPVPW